MRPQVKPPLGQAQERFDIKKGMSRKMASHQNEKSTWWNTLNFRFYKQNIFTFFRKSLYQTVVATAQTLTIPQNSCLVQTHPPIVLPPNLQVTFEDTTNTGQIPPIGTLFVAVDGGSYVEADYTKTYNVVLQIKYKYVIIGFKSVGLTGAQIIHVSFDNLSAKTLGAGSKMTLVGTSDQEVNFFSPFFGFPQDANTNQTTGTFSFSQDLNSSPIPTNTRAAMGYEFDEDYNVSVVIETTLNLV